MKGIKKCLLLALSLAMSATLFAACGGGGNEDNGSSGAGGGNTESSSTLGGNSSESGEVELPDTSIEIPETDGAPVANEAEWNTVFQNSLSATNATIITTASENGTVMESGIVMIAGGVTYEKWSEKDGADDYYFYGEVDGQSYFWHSEDGTTWTVAETGWTPAEYATVAYELEGLDRMLSFASATWNADTGMYTGDSEEGTFSLKISDGKVVYISFYMETAMMPGIDVVYNIVYGQTPTLTVPDMPKEDNGGGDIELPEIPDVDGEEVKDETAWAQAWANTNEANNFTLISTNMYEGKTETAVGVFSDGKSYMVYADENGVCGYEYYGTVDGKNYNWMSEDGKTWVVEEIYTDITVYTTGIGITRGMDQMVDYSSVKYEKGYYLFTVEGLSCQVKIAGGYVVELNIFRGDESMTYKFAYGDAEVVELPPLGFEEIIGEEIKDASEWADVLQNTSAQTNFTCNTVGRTDRGDGKISVVKEYTAVDNGKVYVEMSSTVHSSSGMGGSAMGMTSRSYQGYVDGVAYQWRDMGDGQWHVEEIQEVEDSTIVEFLGLTDLEFATAKFDSETGGYAFATDSAVITVRVVDGLISFVELKTETMFGEFTLTYGDAIVKLPSLNGDGGEGGDTTDPENPNPSTPTPDTGVDYSDIEFTFDMNVGQGIVGEEVSDSELKNAIKMTMASTNFTMQGKSYVQGGSSLISANIANGKMCNATKATYPTETGEYETTTLYTIVGTVNGVDWAWMSFDGVNFEDGPAEDVIMSGWRDGNDVFGPYLQIFFASEYTFNENTGEYIVEADGTTIAIKIVDGEVKTIYMTDGDMYILYVITYGNALDFNLPPVTNSGESGGSTSGEMPSQEEWDYAFETLLTCNNVGLKVFDERSYYDGTQSTEVAGYAVTENAIEYIIERRGDDETLQRMVLANENGEDTMYTFSNETGIWTKADSAFMSAADLWGMQTYYLGRYAGIYERMEWDTEKGCFYLEEFTYISGDGNIYAPVYNLCIYINGGQVMEITYEVKESEYSAQVSYVFYGYNDMKVTIPVDGQGDIGGESGGDIGGGEVEIPDIDTSMIGEEVSAEAFEKILANTYAQENLRYVQRYENENLSVIAVANFADGKGYEDVTVTLLNASGGASTQRQYDYIGTVDGVTYMWISYDGTTWNCSEANGEDAISPNGSYFAEYLDGFVFASASFNSETGMYIMYSETATISLKIYKELIVEFSVQTESENTSFVIEYGNASVGDLPPVPSDGSTSGENDGEQTVVEGTTSDKVTTDTTVNFN